MNTPQANPVNDTRNPEHGIAGASYRLDLFPNECTMECTCGEVCGGPTWQEAGTELDAHLVAYAKEAHR